jgi:hypothetical protein
VPSPLPYLLEQIKIHLITGLSSDVERKVRGLKKKFSAESDKALIHTIEANKQAMYIKLDEARNLQIQIIVLEDILKVRQILRKANK